VICESKLRWSLPILLATLVRLFQVCLLLFYFVFISGHGHIFVDL
jgi:hypothetical protein